MKNLLLTITVLILSSTMTNAQYQKTEIFYDNFVNNHNSWATENNIKWELLVSNGKYYIEHIRDKLSLITHKTIEVKEYENFEIDVSITKTSGIQNNGFGIVWGRKDSYNQFEFLISGNGSYKIVRVENGNRQKIVNWTSSSYINKENGAVNKLTIRKIDNQTKFFINDNFVTGKTFQSFFGDRIGFVIFKNQKIAIDYLRVSYLEKETHNYPPKISITEPDISRGFKVVPAKSIRVTGRAKDSDGIYEVTANGIEANLQSGGYFSVNVPLAVGDNSITVKATDTKMKSATKTFEVNRKSENVINNYTTNEKRVALIFGNSNYSRASNLGVNPINDARDIASTLRTLGFEVIIKTDANLSTMNNAIREFGRQNRDVDVALFYFAGHGMQVERVNYLLPVGVNIKDKNDVNFECVSVNTIQKIMETSNADRLNLIVLDACRNNPFRSWQRGGETGLADMTPPSGTLIAFATSPGSTASNGSGQNGLYTEELIKQLKKPQRIEDVFINTRIEVEKKSGGQQSPWELARLRGKYFLVK